MILFSKLLTSKNWLNRNHFLALFLVFLDVGTDISHGVHTTGRIHRVMSSHSTDTWRSSMGKQSHRIQGKWCLLEQKQENSVSGASCNCATVVSPINRNESG